jgi:calcineurin-like phosphoesterase family protein
MRIDISQNNVFFCSDPHYHHKSLVKGVTNWSSDSECRDFATLEEHDNLLVENINKTVGENDILFCLGDWAFGRIAKEDICYKTEFRNRINCKTIHFVLGNHDGGIVKNTDNVRDIFSSVSNYLEVTFVEPYIGTEQGIKASKQKVIMMHYPIRSWNYVRHGSWMLHGHCHANLPDYVVKGNVQRTMDVGFDAHPEFRPFSYEEVKEIMSKRKVFTEDHH